MVFKVALLASLVRLLLATGSPFLCSSIYALAGLIFAFFSGATLEAAIIGTAMAFVIASIYFWFLHRYEDTTLLFWTIFVTGVVFLFGSPMLYQMINDP